MCPPRICCLGKEGTMETLQFSVLSVNNMRPRQRNQLLGDTDLGSEKGFQRPSLLRQLEHRRSTSSSDTCRNMSSTQCTESGSVGTMGIENKEGL